VEDCRTRRVEIIIDSRDRRKITTHRIPQLQSLSHPGVVRPGHVSNMQG
jgi:hypothetical protein